MNKYINCKNENLTPFKTCCLENFPFLVEDFDSLTNYQLYCKVVEYLNKVATQTNINTKDILDLQNYFANLDVQEEINNKLDQMATDGTLVEIINEYLKLKSIITFNTITDLKESTNLINGSTAQTLGFYEINDGGSSLYKIRTKIDSDIVDNIHIFEIINTNLVAELSEYSKINILQLGASTNLVDNSDIINYAIDNYDVILFPNDLFKIEKSIILKSNKKLFGNNTKIELKNNSNIDLLVGNIIDNVYVDNINFKNENGGTNKKISNYGIANFSNNSNIHFNNCKFTDIFMKGITYIDSNNIKFTNCVFANACYNMLTFLTNCENIIVDKCVFDTITSDNTNAYLFSTGSLNYEPVTEFLCKNITVSNCRFLNNANWEGLESHGCLGFYAYNNYIENCKVGIHVVLDNRLKTNNKEFGDIIIKNNTIIDNNRKMLYGIIVGGEENNFINNVIISNNLIKGIDYQNKSIAIYTLYSNYIEINNNNISNFGFVAIRTAYCCFGNINENNIYNCYYNNANGIVVGRNSWLINCDKNFINGNNLISRAITGENYKGLALLGNNLCINYTQFKYYFSNPNNTLIGSVNLSSDRRLGCRGIYSKDTTDLITMYATDEVIRSVNEVTNLKVSGTSNSNIITCTDNVLNYVCPGQEIIIANANNNENLTTVVDKIIGLHKFTIKDLVLTDVIDVNVSTTSSTWQLNN